MKKYKVLSFILICTMILTFIMGCTSSNNESDSKASESKNAKSNVEDKSKEDEIKEDVGVEEQVLFDQDGITITLKSLELDGIFGPSLKVLVENNMEKSITVQTRDSSVNDIMMDTMFSCDVVPGKKANDKITFSNSELELADVTKIKDIEFKFHISESDSWDEILNTDIINITTTVDPSYVQSYDESGFVALEESGIKIVMDKLSSDDSFWGADIYLYIENNSDNDVTIQARDVSINGIMVDPIFSSDIISGKKAYDTITFLESELVDNDITSIDDMELKFHVIDSNSWDGIYDSPEIEVVFD